MGVEYDYIGRYEVPVNGTIHHLDAVVLWGRQVAFQLHDGRLKPVYRSPPLNGVELVIDIGKLTIKEMESLSDAPQHDGRIPVSVRNLRRSDAARILQEFIRVSTEQTIPLDAILREYYTQIRQLYSGLLLNSQQHATTIN